MSVNVAGGIVTVVIPLYVRDVLLAGPGRSGLLLSVLTAATAGLLIVGAVLAVAAGRSIAWAAALSSGLVLLLLAAPSRRSRPRARSSLVWGALCRR